MASFRVLQQFTRAMSDSVTVKVVQGKLRGKKTTCKYGGDFFTFQGVPYAKPPLGALRFRPPQPLESWSGVRDALAEGEVCPQRDLYTQKMRGDEDCLFLNIHTPKLPEGSENLKKPVIIWIPGGTFTTGHGNMDVYGPDFLIREDVIVVTINYRVGALGFLSMEEAGISGNAGLKDQVFALRWIKENIESFGGDSNNMTLCGDSAGAACVNYHLLSPMSKGLFTKAISLSGSSLNPFSFMETTTAHNRAFALGEVMGCKTDNPQELVDHLMTQSATEISKNLNKTLSKTSNRRGEVFPFLPTVERNPHPEDEVFLPDTPINMLSRGDFQSVPYITGVNSHEGILMLRNLLNDPTMWKGLDDDFEKCIVMPLDLKIERYSDTSRALAEKIKRFYYGDGPLSEKHILHHTNLSTDVYFAVGINQTLRRMVKFSKQPTYFYEFGFSGSLGLFKKFIGVKNMPGTSHGDMLPHVFRHSMVKYDLPPESEEMKTLNSIIKMFTNFAKTGNPTPKSDNSVNVTWEPATVENNMKYLSINKDLSVKTNREKERMEFWNDKYLEFGNKFETSQTDH